MNAEAFILAALNLAPTIIELGGDLVALSKTVTAAMQQPGGPTPADFDTLTAYEADKRATIDASITSDMG